MRLLARWATTMPTTARVTFSQSTATGAAHASSTATRPEMRVIGSTPARVTTSQRVTPSTTPASGGLVVCHAYRHAARRSDRATLLLTGMRLAGRFDPPAAAFPPAGIRARIDTRSGNPRNWATVSRDPGDALNDLLAEARA